MTVAPPDPGHPETQADAVSGTTDATPSATATACGAWQNRLAGRIAKLADKTWSQTNRLTKERIAHAAENVLPEIERTSAKLKEHARPERMKQDYREILHWLHERVLDPPKEQLFFAQTKDPVALSGLTINAITREYGHDYRPTPCQLFEWTLAAIDYDLSKLTFVDHGAGKGRVMLLASEHPFAAIAGVEFAEELHDAATMNIQQYPRSRMHCRNVECILEDACQVGPLEGEAVHYFFNPFSREVFAEVLNNLVVSYRQRPRRLYLILVDPVATDLVDESGVFARMELPTRERLKVRLFSPYEIAIYRSLA